MALPAVWKHNRKAWKKLIDRLNRQGARHGLLIAIEGPEGSGKTTQRKLLKEWLASEGRLVVTSRSGSAPAIKPLVSARKAAHALGREEHCLFHAAEYRYRLEHEILPALWQGKIVLADQYVFTSLARDAARGLPLNWVLNAYDPIFWPDMVLYLSVSAETSFKRVSGTRLPKYYEAGQDVTGVDNPLESFGRFLRRLVQEYESLATVFRFLKVDAEQSIYHQHQSIRRFYHAYQPQPWSRQNAEAVLEWLQRTPPPSEARHDR
jgi:dTMP kinase